MSHQDILSRLASGDMRTTGAADEVAQLLIADPDLVAPIIAALRDGTDPGLRMRAADALEKASVKHPEIIAPYKEELLGPIALVEQQEVQWHIALMLPRLPLEPGERHYAARILQRYYQTAASRIVRVNALQALADLATLDPELRPMADDYIQKALADPSRSLRARASQLTDRPI